MNRWIASIIIGVGLMAVPTAALATSEASASSTTCAEYHHNDTLPLRVCDSGDVVQAARSFIGAFSDATQPGGACLFTPEMEQAVRNYQAGAGLPVTGEVDQATWDAFNDWIDSMTDDYGETFGLEYLFAADAGAGGSSFASSYYAPSEVVYECERYASVTPPSDDVTCNMTATAEWSSMSCSGDGVYLSAHCSLIDTTMYCTSHQN